MIIDKQIKEIPQIHNIVKYHILVFCIVGIYLELFNIINSEILNK